MDQNYINILGELTGRLECLEKKMQICQDRQEIMQLMSRYQFYLASGEGIRIPEKLWTANCEDCSIEVGASGPYVGMVHVSSYYEKDNVPGRITVHTMDTPCIEIDGTGRTAKGIWMSIGSETDAGDLGLCPPKTLEEAELLTSHTSDGKRFKAEWVWQKYEVVFIREEECWKIHHLHIYEIFRCPYEENWVTWSEKRPETDGLRLDAMFTSNIPFGPGRPFENLPARGSTFHWQYSTKAVPVLKPEIP